MSSRNFSISTLACSLAIGCITLAPVASAVPAWSLRPAAGLKSGVIAIKYRRRAKPLFLPIAPNYLAYDYPYYYRRGFYPRHIGPGYVYYGYPYSRYRKIYRGRCTSRRRGCIVGRRGSRAKWEACTCR